MSLFRGVVLLIITTVVVVGLVLWTGQKYLPKTSTLPSTCTALDGGALPDPACTPGVFNHDVTQRTIKTTICKAGWTSTIRPPVTTTEPQKFEMMRKYGISTKPGQAQRYEFDHLIPLELGGAVDDLKNMWPELHYVIVNHTQEGSYIKDKWENTLHDDVCNGEMKLWQARRIMVKGTWMNG